MVSFLKFIFYAFDKNDNVFYSYWELSEDFSKDLYSFKKIALCGTMAVENGEEVFRNIGFVIPSIKDGHYFLKTAADDRKDNNLLSLEEAYQFYR